MDIQIASLTFTFPSGITALSEVSLDIPAGAGVGVVGQNGAGKTTLVKHLNGLLRPTSGSVRVGDWETRQHSVAQLATRVGYVFQNPDDQLFQSTLRAEIIFGPKNLGYPTERAESAAQAALELVELTHAADSHPYDLTPGERKRAALASVLAMDTPVIVLDEPTTGQDSIGVERIGRIVDDLKRQGKTVITITHDIDFCAEHFERVVVMLNGRVLLDGSGREVLPQADILARTYVEPPQMMRLAMALGMERMPLAVDEFIDYYIGAPSN
jgi:energy-coupling factor transport system ATP-binding protein